MSPRGYTTPVETRTAPLIGGRYRINGLLGQGGMARVFDAFDELLERPAAVKILRAETRALPGMRERFQQEALIAARLLHPHIVDVFDFGEDHASSFLVMERLPGSTLRDEIVIRGPRPGQRVMLVTTETLAALATAHSHGVLHRDIKPSNILLQPDGHTKITDFGIAKSFDIRPTAGRLTDDMTMTGVVLGTPGYLAPERRAAVPASVQSDLYSVGAVMVEMFTGQRLAPGPAPTDGLPAPFGAVARRALADDPRHRFSSAAEMLHALQVPPNGPSPATRSPRPVTAPPTAPARPAAGTPTLTPPTRVPTRPHSPRARVRMRRRGLAVAALAIVALAAAAFVLFEQHARPTGPTNGLVQHPAASPQTRALTRPSTTSITDVESSAISTLAASLADGGFPGDRVLARALQNTAAQPPGTDRESSAQQALSLAAVLLDGGSITAGQYQDVATVLEPTGAAETTTTTTAPGPVQPFRTPFFRGDDHDRDRGSGGGGQG
jgi:serine/threonine protein kinase